MRSGREPMAYWLVVAVQVLSVWVVPIWPSQDGPLHLYSAHVVGSIVFDADAPVASAFELDRRPIPSWPVHFVLALLLRLVGPATAERWIVTTAIVLFAWGARVAARGLAADRSPIGAWLLVPFGLNVFLRLGFYPFCLGIGAWLLVTGWFTGSASWAAGPRALLVLFGSLGLFFLHPFAFALGAMTIGACTVFEGRGWRERERWRARFVTLGGLIPAALLAVWVRTLLESDRSVAMPLEVRLRQLLGADPLVGFGPPLELVVAAVMPIVFLVALWSSRGRRRLPVGRFGGGLLVVGLVVAVAYLVVPTHFYTADGQNTAGLVTQRLALALWLVAGLWLGTRIAVGSRLGIAATVGAAGVAIGLALVQFGVARQYQPLIGAVESLATEMPRGAEFLEKSYDTYGLLPNGVRLSWKAAPLVHASSRVAVERELVDLDHYQAKSGHFELRYRAGVGSSTTEWILLTGLSAAGRDDVGDLLAGLLDRYEITERSADGAGLLLRRRAESGKP